MALTVETGTGSATADSYLSVADCDTYWTNHGAPATWTAATTAEKEEALRMGTQYLDAVYCTRWKGMRYDDDQALDWPRSGVYDNDGWAIDSDEMPTQLLDATAEAAYRHLSETNGLIPDITNPGTIKRYRVKAAVVEQDTIYAGVRSQIKQFRIIELLLQDLLRPGQILERA